LIEKVRAHITGVQSKQRKWITTLCTQCTSKVSWMCNDGRYGY